MKPSDPVWRCPHCGSTDVERDFEPYYRPGMTSAYEKWKLVDFTCKACGKWEDAISGDPEREHLYDEMVARWRSTETTDAEKSG